MNGLITGMLIVSLFCNGFLFAEEPSRAKALALIERGDFEYAKAAVQLLESTPESQAPMSWKISRELKAVFRAQFALEQALKGVEAAEANARIQERNAVVASEPSISGRVDQASVLRFEQAAKSLRADAKIEVPQAKKELTKALERASEFAAEMQAEDEPQASLSLSIMIGKIAQEYLGGAAIAGRSLAGPSPLPSSEIGEGMAPASLSEALKSVVTIKGKQGSGSGFLCSVGSDSFIFTNAHVLSGLHDFEILDVSGQVIQDVQWLESASEGFANGDVVRLKLASFRRNALRLAVEEPQHGLPIVALGDSGGQGVIRSLDGVVEGVGPDKLEISAEIIPGNSGGPILDSKTFAVVGISTYGVANQSIWSKGTNLEVRRFGLRPSKVNSWDRFEIADFVEQGRYIHQFEENVQVMALLSFLEYRDDGVFYDSDLSVEGEYLVADLIDQHSKHPIVKSLFGVQAKLARNRTSAIKLSRASVAAAYLGEVGAAGQKMSGFRRSADTGEWAWYHRQELAESGILDEHLAWEMKIAKLLKTFQ